MDHLDAGLTQCPAATARTRSQAACLWSLLWDRWRMTVFTPPPPAAPTPPPAPALPPAPAQVPAPALPRAGPGRV